MKFVVGYDAWTIYNKNNERRTRRTTKTKQKQMPPKSTSKKIYLESHAQKGRCNDVYKRFPMILKNKNVLI